MHRKKQTIFGLLAFRLWHFDAMQFFKQEMQFVKKAAMDINMYKLMGIPTTCTNTVRIFAPLVKGVMSP